MSAEPNREQREIIRASKTGKSMVIVAGAGTGKTTTLEMLAKARPHKNMLYLAYNRAIKDEASQRFPSNVKCATSHGLAFATTGRQFGHRMNSGRVPSWKASQILGLQPARLAYCLDHGQGVPDGDHAHDSCRVLAEHLDGKRIAALAMRTVARFCYSADRELGPAHVSRMKGLDERLQPQLKDLVLPVAQDAWKDLIRPDGRLGFTHDVYLKLFQLRSPRLPQQVILLDEAQDTNPCVADIVISQQAAGKQVILVGDPNQAIYEWRGAQDAIDGFDAENRMMLTGSYRFGPKVAEEANRWLELLGSELRLKGWKRLNSEVTDVSTGSPDAILYRTNAGCINGAMAGIAAGEKVAIVGGGGEIASLARAASDLMTGRTTDHPDLIAFADWDEVRTYVKDEPEDAGQLGPLVRAVDKYGPDVILDMTNQLVAEASHPTLTVSTAHKAKGRQWGYVRIGDDFPQPKEDGPQELPKEELRLAYVAITRAQNTLERGSLAWIGPLPEPDDEEDEVA